MTRTERATFPRALIRDRSESKSGLDKSFRKGGGGNHNWGSIADEGYLEAAALDDEEQSLATEQESRGSCALSSSLIIPSLTFPKSTSLLPREATTPPPKTRSVLQPALGRPLSRAKVHSCHRSISCLLMTIPDIDLSAIARTSGAVSTSPTARVAVV